MKSSFYLDGKMLIAMPNIGDERFERSVIFLCAHSAEGAMGIVVNKPAGVAVHGGSGLSFGVIEALRAMHPELKELELVHRLDRETSGCLLVAKRRAVLRDLHAKLRERDMEKRYYALVVGRWPYGNKTIDLPLKTNLKQGGERVVRVHAEGQQLVLRGAVEQLVSRELVEAAVAHPPDDTRAYFRGEAIARYGGQISAASWDSVIFDVPGAPTLQRVPMRDPLRGTREHVGALLDRSPDAASLLAALGA